MQRRSHPCPGCSQPLGISWDMWGQFYVCPECGFTAEDDDELSPQFQREAAESKQAFATPESAGKIHALIFSEERTTERCEGPDWAGRCPRAGTGCPVACAGRWITAAGWVFRVAPNAEYCPLAGLGLGTGKGASHDFGGTSKDIAGQRRGR